MADSTFDSETFMNREVTGVLETRYPTIPEGTYPGMIDSVRVHEETSAKGTFHICDIQWLMHDEGLKAKMETDRILAKQSIFLDVDSNGAILFGPGKNIKLGQVREAVKQNDGKSWSFNRLVGAGPCDVTIGIHVPDTSDPDTKYNRVYKVVTR